MTTTHTSETRSEYDVRKAKVQQLRDMGIQPYAQGYDKQHSISDLIGNNKKNLTDGHVSPFRDINDIITSPRTDRQTAGRLTLFRAHGKLSFGRLMDESGEIQLMFHRDACALVEATRSSKNNTPFFVLVCGLPGSGKSFVAKEIAKKLGYECMISDEVRHRILDIAHLSREEQIERITTYTCDLMDQKGQQKKGLVLDAVFMKSEQRQMMIDYAIKYGLCRKIIYVSCENEDIIKQRLAQRIQDKEVQRSGATYDDYIRIKKIREPITHDHEVIYNNGTIEETLNAIKNIIDNILPSHVGEGVGGEVKINRSQTPLFNYATKEGAETEHRDLGVALVYNPKTDSYLCHKRYNGDQALIAGGIEVGEDATIATMRETHEETGYKNLRFITELSPCRSVYWREDKQKNYFTHNRNFVFELINDEQDPVDPSEMTKHTPMRVNSSEVQKFLRNEGGIASSDHLFVWDEWMKKHIGAITNETFGVPRDLTVQCKERSSARAIIVNDQGLVCLMHAQKADFYKLPGGGVDDGESIVDALIREVKEETGYDVIKHDYLGVVEEWREYDQNNGLHHISHGFVVRVHSHQGEKSMTQSEQDAEFTTTRKIIDEALYLIQSNSERMGNNSHDSMGIQFMSKREELFLKKYQATFSPRLVGEGVGGEVKINRSSTPLFDQYEIKQDKPTIHRNIGIALVYNPKTDSYLCHKRKADGAQTLIGGGIEEGEDAVTATMREVEEETGYINLRFVTELSPSRSHFWHESKQANYFTYNRNFVFELIDETQNELDPAELAKHTPQRIPANNMKEFLTNEGGISSVDHLFLRDERQKLHLATITNETFGVARNQSIECKQRSSARAVIMNNKGEIGLMHAQKNDFYKLPGGGIDDNESVEEALRREILEETGYMVKEHTYLGVVEEYREYGSEPLHHVSHGFVVQVHADQQATGLTPDEQDAQFMLVWKSRDEALKLIQENAYRMGDKVEDILGIKFMSAREESFLKAVRKQTNTLLTGAEATKFLEKLVDVGDFIGVRGELFHTHKGELTLFVSEFSFLTKALRPLGDKFHGIGDDKEKAYRQRYLDMIFNRDTLERMKLRSKFLTTIRQFYDQNGFIEVETPVLGHSASGAAAAPFITHHNDFDLDMYLRISPETNLKKATVGMLEKVFEVAKDFRNEGSDPSHIQEFTMIEHYAAYRNYEDNMRFTEQMFDYIFAQIPQLSKVVPVADKNGVVHQVNFQTPRQRIDYISQIKQDSGIDVSQYSSTDEEKLRNDILSAGHTRAGIETQGVATMIDYLYKKVTRPKIIGPAFVVNYPATMQPLARKSDANPGIVEQRQLVVNGRELIKAYSELVDPIQQQANFDAQSDAIAKGDNEATKGDDDFVLAMEYGMPCQSGRGMGVDRILAMLTSNGQLLNIRDVILFPLVKPEHNDAGKTTNDEKTEKKSDQTQLTVILLNQGAKLEPRQEMNTIAHLTAAFGARQGKAGLFSHNTIQTKDHHDIFLNIKNAIMIKTIPDNTTLQVLRAKALNEGLHIADFTREMIQTTDDKKIVAITAEKSDHDIEHLGLLISGPKKVIEVMTKGFGLYGK